MDAAFPDRLRKCAEEMRREGIVGKAAAGAPFAMELAAEEIVELRALVEHCWIHSGYRNCGYDQMTTEQKALFDSITTPPVVGDPLPSLSADDLLARAVRNARDRHCRKGEKHPRWVAVMDWFSLGSGFAHMLCRRYRLDPDEQVKR